MRRAADDRQGPGWTARDVAVVAAAAVLAALLLRTFVLDAVRVPSRSMVATLLPGDFVLVDRVVYGARTPRVLPFTSLPIPSFRLPGLRRPAAGDVLVFRHAWEPGPQGRGGVSERTYVKRCVGLPGDTVAIAAGEVLVNGRRLAVPPRSPDEEMPPRAVPRRGDVVDLTPATVGRLSGLIRGDGHSVALGAGGAVLVDGLPASSYRVADDCYFVLGDNAGDSIDSRELGAIPGESLLGRAMMVYWSWEESAGARSLLGRLCSIRWRRIGTLVR